MLTDWLTDKVAIYTVTTVTTPNTKFTKFPLCFSYLFNSEGGAENSTIYLGLSLFILVNNFQQMYMKLA